MMKNISQAGAITFRVVNNEIQFLLIRSKKNPSIWIFPKGHVELEETESETAVRELMEEAGVEGKIVGNAGTIAFSYNNKNYIVVYYILEFVTIVTSGEFGREPRWCSYEEALNILTFSNSRDILISSNSFVKRYLSHP